MKTTKILWSGLTGKTGLEALKQQVNVEGVEISGGMSRKPMSDGRYRNLGLRDDTFKLSDELADHLQWYDYAWLSEVDKRLPHPRGYDVLVDFSHPDVFEQVLDIAAVQGKPLVSGTSGLSKRQMAELLDTTKLIPIFRGGNFRFKVKHFIDEAVKMADGAPGKFVLIEHFYKGKELPSETSKVVQRRVAEVTDKEVEIRSYDDLDCQDLPCSWKFQVHSRTLPDVIYSQTYCYTIGFDELAHDVLEIAKVMAHKPVRPGKFYDLDEIWDELPH